MLKLTSNKADRLAQIFTCICAGGLLIVLIFDIIQNHYLFVSNYPSQVWDNINISNKYGPIESNRFIFYDSSKN